MHKYIFTCNTCDTIVTIETKLDKDNIHLVPPCPCGKSRMIWMGSEEYKYGHGL